MLLENVTHFSKQNDKCKHSTVGAPCLTHDCKGKVPVNALKAHAEVEIERHLFSFSVGVELNSMATLPGINYIRG
jgi:galactokinase/mevalonate kinase-like predicted kinase